MNAFLQFKKISKSRTDLYNRKYPYEVNTGNFTREFVLCAGTGWTLTVNMPRAECKLVDPWWPPRPTIS